MSVFDRAISEREKGEAVPMSIGTALAFESICGLGEFLTPQPQIMKHDVVWINIRTLFRNCLGSIGKDYKNSVRAQDIVHGMVEDCRIIESTLTSQTTGRVKPVFYFCSFKGLEKEFKYAYWKQVKTNKQKIEQDLETSTIKLFLKEENIQPDLDYRHYDVKITDSDRRAIILTHYPVDLLWRKKFATLMLLESHTGKLKSKVEWYTKLTNGKKYSRIPFNRLTLQLFGDNNLIFASMLPSLKNKLLEIAEQDKWTPATTDERVSVSLNKIYDPREKTFFLNLLRS